MKINYGYIKVVLLLVTVVALFMFANNRNKKRLVGTQDIVFLGEKAPFITDANVSNMLIQNQQAITEQSKEIIDLTLLEEALNTHPIIKKAEVFMAINGTVSAEIEQKKPVARVNTNVSYYIDQDGGYMPLSENFTARVPLVTGFVDKANLETVCTFAKFVDEDDFLKKHIIEIHQNKDNTLNFKVRKSDFEVHLGTLEKLQKKINNFKVFYQKASKNKLLASYKHVNLKFDKQVICTKKS